MAFFDNLKDKVSDFAQAGVAKSKQMAEIAKLNKNERYYYATDEQLNQYAAYKPEYEKE